MQSDAWFAGDLREWRAQVDACKARVEQARRTLQAAGQAAYAALGAAGYTSGQVAHSVGVSDGTIRKLKAVEGKTGWSPRSHDLYDRLDQYTLARLGRCWNLARLREALDTAETNLKDATGRLEEVSARSDGALPVFDLGILLVPGLPGRRVDRSLRQFGDALVASFVEDDRQPRRSIEVADTQLAAGGGPARLVLRHRSPDDEQGSAAGTGHQWLVAVSPVDQYLRDDQDLRDFLRWLLVALPWSAADAFDRRHQQGRCLPGAVLLRWSRAASNAVTGLVGIPLLLLALVLVFACLIALYLPLVRPIGRAVAGLLSRGFGLTFAYACGQATLDAQVNRAASDLAWLRPYCQQVAVVAYGHGVPVAYELVRRAPADVVHRLVTLGSPLRRFRFAQALQGRPEHTFGGIGGLLAWLWAAGFSLLWCGIAALVVVLAVRGNDPGAAVVAAVSTALLGALIVWFAAWSRRVLRTEVLPVRLRALGRPQQPLKVSWLDLVSAVDPVADGPYLAAAMPLGETQVEVTHQASAWADHRSYLKPGSEALRRLLDELIRLAQFPHHPVEPNPETRRRRVWWLVLARRAAVLSGLVSAFMLLPRLPSWAARPGPGIAALLLLWAAGAGTAYLVLKSCWRLWDYSQRGYEIARAQRRKVTVVPIYTGFALFLEALVVVALWPVGLALGWWSGLLRGAMALAASFDGGDPGRRPAALLIELALAVLVGFGAAVTFGLLLSRPALRCRLERHRRLPDSVTAASQLLQKLPEGGLDVGGGRYRALPIAWDVSVPGIWRRGKPEPCAAPTRMLLRDDAVVLDLRDGCMLKVSDDGEQDERLAHVHGRQVRWAPTAAAGVEGASKRPRLANYGDWRAFRRDLPELLKQISSLGSGSGQRAGRPLPSHRVHGDGEGLASGS